MIEFKMPSLGADMEAGILREWRKKAGDTVHRGDIIADVETQKGIIEIEVFSDGKIEQLLIKENEKVPVGTLMALISNGAEKESADKSITLKSEVGNEDHRIRITPLAKKMAEENKIDYSLLSGSGEEGAITKTDIEAAISQRHSSETKTVSVPGIRQAIAAAMARSWKEIPHYYLQTKVDMSKLISWLNEINGQLSADKRILPLSPIMKAIALSLKEVPDLNAEWRNELLRKEKINIGFVVSLRQGGIVIPAISEVDKKDPQTIMQALNDIIPRAKKLKLKSSELSESTITVTSLGDDSAETVFGIIYPPQVALIGLGSVHEEPFAEAGMLTVRQVMNISLSADHRASDGHAGGRFLSALKHYLLNPEKL